MVSFPCTIVISKELEIKIVKLNTIFEFLIPYSNESRPANTNLRTGSANAHGRPGSVDTKLKAEVSKYKLTSRVGNHRLKARASKHNLGLETRTSKQIRAGGHGWSPGNTDTWFFKMLLVQASSATWISIFIEVFWFSEVDVLISKKKTSLRFIWRFLLSTEHVHRIFAISFINMFTDTFLNHRRYFLQ